MRIRYSHRGKTKTYESQQEDVRLGRPTATGERPDLDLTPDEKVSRLHAHIWWEEEHYWIEDLKSSRGTFVNGENIKTTGKVKLDPAAVIRIGETELQLLTEEKPSLRLVVRCLPAINYSLLYCGIPFFTEIIVFNDGKAALKNITLQLVLEGYAEPLSITIPSLPANKSYRVNPPPKLKLKREKFLNLAEPITTTLTAQLDRQLLPLEPPVEISLLPPNAWHFVEYDEALAGFVMRNSDAVEEVIRRARFFLRRLMGGVRSFADALTSDDEKRREKMAQAIYDCLQEKYHIDYEFEPRTDEDDWQMVRFHHEVLEYFQGTCIDLALLFAACLEHVHLNPMILLIQTREDAQHALFGFRTSEGRLAEAVIVDEWQIRQRVQTGELILLDSIGFAYGKEAEQTFTECRTRGREHFDEYQFLYALDILTARINGFAPMPFGTGVQFDRAASLAIFRARREAEHGCHKFVGARHLFLGLLSIEEGLLSQVLNHLGPATSETVANDICRSFGPPAAQPQPGTIPESDDLKSILNRAKQQAKREERLMVTEAQLLRSLLESPGQVEKILRRVGLTPQDCLAQLDVIAPHDEVLSRVESEWQTLTNNETDLS